MKIIFFRTPKPKRFEYSPRYYDEEKERLERRKKELGIGDQSKTVQDQRAKFAEDWQRLRHKDRTRRKSMQISILVYLFIAAILLYFIFLV